MKTDQKGAIAEIEVAAAAVRLGVPVFKPVAERGRADLVLEIGGQLLRVQCKWGRKRGDVIVVNIGGNYLTPAGYVRSTYSADEIDVVASYCQELDRCYLLPVSLIEGCRSIQLRLAPTRNNQRASLHWAAEYEFDGAIAQLEERLRGTQEAAGSSPASSTSPLPPTQIGANEFHKRFGYWAEQVVGGREVLVTRWGKPYLRLAAAQPKLVAA